MDPTAEQELEVALRRSNGEVVWRRVQLAFPHRTRAEQQHAAGRPSWGGFVVLPQWLVGSTAYEIRFTEIPEGVMAVSTWLQEAEEWVPIVGTARFHTEGRGQGWTCGAASCGW